MDELIVVLGYQKEILENLIIKNEKTKIIYNKNFKTGMASSIKCGLNNISKKTEFFFICLSDMPEIRANIYNEIIKFKKSNEIIVPTYNGRQGNPVLFSSSMISKIMTIKGDVGAKKIIQENKDKILNLEINEEGIIKDYNTQENFSN